MSLVRKTEVLPQDMAEEEVVAPYSEPVPSTPPPREELDDDLRLTTIGVACAVFVLLKDYQSPIGRAPRLLNERLHPFIGAGSDMASFVWVDLLHDLDIPPISAVRLCQDQTSHRPPSPAAAAQGPSTFCPHACR